MGRNTAAKLGEDPRTEMTAAHWLLRFDARLRRRRAVVAPATSAYARPFEPPPLSPAPIFGDTPSPRGPFVSELTEPLLLVRAKPAARFQATPPLPFVTAAELAARHGITLPVEGDLEDPIGEGELQDDEPIDALELSIPIYFEYSARPGDVITSPPPLVDPTEPIQMTFTPTPAGDTSPGMGMWVYPVAISPAVSDLPPIESEPAPIAEAAKVAEAAPIVEDAPVPEAAPAQAAPSSEEMPAPMSSPLAESPVLANDVAAAAPEPLGVAEPVVAPEPSAVAEPAIAPEPAPAPAPVPLLAPAEQYPVLAELAKSALTPSAFAMQPYRPAAPKIVPMIAAKIEPKIEPTIAPTIATAPTVAPPPRVQPPPRVELRPIIDSAPPAPVAAILESPSPIATASPTPSKKILQLTPPPLPKRPLELTPPSIPPPAPVVEAPAPTAIATAIATSNAKANENAAPPKARVDATPPSPWAKQEPATPEPTAAEPKSAASPAKWDRVKRVARAGAFGLLAVFAGVSIRGAAQHARRSNATNANAAAATATAIATSSSSAAASSSAHASTPPEGDLEIRAPANVPIYVDGRDRGRGPQISVRLAPGYHMVRVGPKRTQLVEIHAGKNVSIDVAPE